MSFVGRHSNGLRMTQTGQTGRVAYVAEAAAIQNEMRELNARWRDLLRTMHEEMPELFHHSSDYSPELSSIKADSGERLVEYLRKERCECTMCRYRRGEL